jgi:hypothetical protein
MEMMLMMKLEEEKNLEILVIINSETVISMSAVQTTKEK